MSLEKRFVDVILLKSNDDSDTTKKKDRYIQALEQQHQSSFQIASNLQINLLKFSYLNSKEIYSRLNKCLASNETSSHKCLILTSRQAIESIQVAFDDLLTTTTNTNSNESSFSYKENIDEYDIDKTRLIIYCVGDVTKTRFKHFVQEKLVNYHPHVLNDIIIRTPSSLGQKQNAKSLANLIIDDYNYLKVKYKEASIRLFSHTYALYPCSSIRKDDLSDQLKINSISLEEIVAYETVQDDLAVMRFYSNLSNYLTKCENRVCCFVFFSPSGCNAVFNFKHEEYVNIKKKILTDKSGKFVFISIGPSTSSKLKEFVDEVCVHELREPSPEALVEKLTTLLV